jgi:Glycosyl-transferase for dystroglycan
MDWLKRESAEKRVFVLPAFETAPLKDLVEAHTVAARAAASDKAGLQALVKDGKLWQFALKIFREGHNVTEYARWFNTSEAYGPLKVTRDYEPWFIADRRSLPFWDGVFRGYGWNKVTHVTNTHQSGFDFFVHPEGFLVHRQHGHSASSSLYQKSKTAYEATLKKDQARAARDTSLAATTHK